MVNMMSDLNLDNLGIGNYYGGIVAKEEGGKFYWGIEDHDGITFEEIPESLYRELAKHNKALKDEF